MVPVRKIRIEATLQAEKALYRQGFKAVAGVDEAGRGPLAGPVVAAAVILPLECKIEGICDSKMLSPKQREELAQEITTQALVVGIGEVWPEVIDKINIHRASFLAMKKAVEAIQKPKPDFLLVDGFQIPGIKIPQKALLQGDKKSVVIGAASILAKVTRDRIMVALHQEFPEYGFAQHKGYGTAFHIKAIQKYGPCKYHRKSFKRVKEYVSEERNTGGKR
jgi:ribonuclease HII